MTQNTKTQVLNELLIGSPDPKVYFVVGEESSSKKRHIRILIDNSDAFAHEYFVRDIIWREEQSQDGVEAIALENISTRESCISLEDIADFVRGYSLSSKAGIDYTDLVDCVLFLYENMDDLSIFSERLSYQDCPWEFAGHLFWLTRAKQGDFYCIGVSGNLAKKLSDSALAFPSIAY